MRADYAEKLKIKVNPHYDHDIPPEENEFTYWNPVSANNDLMKLANAAIDITQQSTQAMRERTTARAKLRETRWKREQIERKLLAGEPLKPAEAKTLKTVGAAVLARAWADPDKAAALSGYEETEEKLEREVETLSGKIDEWQTWLKTVEQVSDNIKTALAFYKDERRNNG